MSRRRAAALMCLVSCRGLLEIPDDPHVEPESAQGRHHREWDEPDDVDAREADAGRANAPTPVASPVSATSPAGVAPSTSPDASAVNPERPALGADAGVEATSDAPGQRQRASAGSRGLALR